jgi:hypothetical protein
MSVLSLEILEIFLAGPACNGRIQDISLSPFVMGLGVLANTT